jgi:hypothetical protein
MEEFALAQDRTKVLEQLIPGTEDHSFYQCLHLQHQGDLAQVETVLKAWIGRHNETARVQEIRNRQALLGYPKDPKTALERIRRQLGVSFNHQREVEGQKTSYPTELDPATVTYAAWKARALSCSHSSDASGFADTALEDLLADELEGDRRRAVLTRLRRPDHPNLVKQIVLDLAHRHSSGFGSLPIHRLLLVDQLDELVRQVPALATNQEWIHEKVKRLRPSPDVAWESDPKEREAYLERLWRFVGSLAPAYNSLKAHVLYHRLDLDRGKGVFDRGRFLEYVKLPRQTSYAEPKFLALKEHRDVLANLGSDYRAVTLLPPVSNDEPLVRDYLTSFFEKAESWQPFELYIRDGFLKQVFATTKILLGTGDMEQWYSLLNDPGAYQALKERVDIEFAATNRTAFQADDPVSIDVYVKNVPTLVVKVLEINSLSYLLATGREPDTAIDLDGLVASETQTHTFPEPPLRRVRRTFAFPTLRKPGLFVVELIGNGKSSRALVRKGRLRVLERIGAAGHVFTIQDEKNQPLEDATLWLSGREYRPGETGITVPFTNQPRRQAILLRHGELTTLEWFQHQAESYVFSAGIFCDRESLLRRKQAQVAVRPQLLLHETPVSTKLVEDAALIVTSTDRHGVSSSKEVPGFELHQDRESVFTFQVPEDLASITFTVKGRIQSLSTASKIAVADARTYALNQIDTTERTEDLHLARTEDGHVISLLGKTGEPRPDRPVFVELTHRDFTTSYDATLQTDAAGRIVLGALPRVATIRAVSPVGVEEKWSLGPESTCRFPRTIHGQAGVPLAIPFVGTAKEPSGEALSLLERLGDGYVRDHRAKLALKGGFLEIAGLPAGDFDLLLKEQAVAINLRITAGKPRGSWVLSEARLLEARVSRWLQITDIESGKEALEVRLANASRATRVHVTATRFAPAHSLGDDLGAIAVLEPRCLLAARSLTNYVSGRDLGDEYRYALERKFATKLPGNMLTRPGLLLNPWAMRKTDTGVQQAGAGSAYGAMPAAPPMQAAYRSAPEPMARSAEGAFANLDFLERPSTVVFNLRPDERGVVTIPASDLAWANEVTVLALDLENAVTRRIALPEVEAAPKDLRLLLGLDPEKHFTEKKQVTVLPTGSTLEVADITTSKVEAYDTLGRVHALYSTLSGNATLAAFAFVLKWPTLTPAEKSSRLSEFACHELHFFIARKDRAYFEKVLVPYLRNKRAKTFMDHFLLGDDLSGYLKPWAHGRLNVVERILLAERIASDRKATARHVAEGFDLLPRNVEEENRLFRTAIQGSALETDDAMGLEAATRDATRMVMAKAAHAGGGPGGAVPPMGMAMLSAPAPASPARRSAGKAKKSEMSKESRERARSDDADEAFAADMAPESASEVMPQDLEDRKQVRQFYKKLEMTQELGENNYYHLRVEEQGPGLVTVNAFWRDFARHDGKTPFLSPHFAQASRTFTEMMFALSVLDLPFEKGTPEVAYEGARMRLKAKRETIVFHKEIKPATPTTKPVPILVSQNYFRSDDRYREEDGEQVDKYVTDEFLVHTVYLAQVVLTNPTSSQQKLDVLLQIPRGAIPVSNGFETRGETIHLSSYATESKEYAFYFPAPGKFHHYPVHVAKDEALVVSAPPTVLNVVEQPSKIDRTSWAYVSQEGTSEEVLAFLDQGSIARLDLSRIAWRMRDRKFHDQVLALLARRHVYDGTLWSYSLHHDDATNLREYLLHQDGFLRQCGLALESPLVTIDPVDRGWYEHREYAPFVNARAHRLGARRKILNDRFAAQYAEWTKLLCYRKTLGDDDLMAVTYYLLLADRVEEALATFGRVDAKKIATRIQHDYLRAYLAFFEDDPRAARGIVQPYADYPVDRWRNLFQNVIAQLDELEGSGVAVADPEDRSQRQGSLAATEPSFELAVENRAVLVHYQNLTEVRANYYLMDIELLFSRQPFVQQQSGQFAFIRPNRSDLVRLPADKSSLSFALPPEFTSANVIVELVAAGARKSQAYYAHVLLLQLIESYGQLKVAHQTSGKPLPRVYVKVYARMRSGEVRFYKDGYTDARGRFDYTSLSTDELEAVERFALLILSEEHGAVIREAAPPKR